MNYKLDTDNQVFFYEQDFYVLSNFSAFTLQWKGHRFDTSEAAYHWEKFNYGIENTEGEVERLPSLITIQFSIIHAPSAHEAFKLAEKYKSLVRPDWSDIRVEIMRDILHAKATQHEYVYRKLLSTGDRELVEDSWRDSFWGWGANQTGENMLGKLWMEVRKGLREIAGLKEACEEMRRSGETFPCLHKVTNHNAHCQLDPCSCGGE